MYLIYVIVLKSDVNVPNDDHRIVQYKNNSDCQELGSPSMVVLVVNFVPVCKPLDK